MSRILTTVILIFVIAVANCQMSFTAFLNSINNIPDPASKVVLIDTFLNQLGPENFPYIEGDKATFIFNGPADSVWIAGDFNGWGASMWKCSRIEDTDFFYYTAKFNLTARVDYKFIINRKDYSLDPRNPNQVSGGFGTNSELAMPDYIQPWEIEENNKIGKGCIESFSLESREVGRTFSIRVYLPPGYEEAGDEAYATVYVQDGSDYTSLGSMDIVLDNLLNKNKIDPLIVVFISPIDRYDEYAYSMRFKYAKFVAKTLVPYIDANYNTHPKRTHRLTLGTSIGGNSSALISYNYPYVFGNSAWHSPAFWVNEGEVARMYISEKKDVKIYFNMGSYEDLGVDWEKFRSGLDAHNYEYSWQQYHEGHSWGLWRATIDDILLYFFPPGFSKRR